MKRLKLMVFLQAALLSVMPPLLYGGMEWVQATDSAGWMGRYSHTSVVYNNLVWLMGGHDSTALKRDVWNSSDGVSWVKVTGTPGWTARSAHTSVVFGGKLWVIGGLDSMGYQKDVWYSTDGMTWIKATGSPAWTGRMGHTSVVFNNEMWILGGYDSTGVRHDVWHSLDGVTWSNATDSAGWSPRYDHSAVVCNGKIWVIGGYNGANLSDVWYSSDGAFWTKAAASPGWRGKYAHTTVAHGNQMWLFGGHDSSGWSNEVWHSLNGVNWVQATNSIGWTPRECHSSVTFNGKLWVIGGYNSNSLDDVWCVAIDTVAPAKPENLVALGKNPSPWSKDSLFEIGWKNPTNQNGIARMLYKLNSPPGNNHDTTGWWHPTAPRIVLCKKEGISPFYLWFEDSAGNINYINNSVVDIRRDTTMPSVCTAVSPTTTNYPNFMVRWSKSSDSPSGVKGYCIRVQNSTSSSWEQWLENYKDTFALYNGANHETYYFEACAVDSAGNFSFKEIPQCSTYVNVSGGDTISPPPPESLEVVPGDREAFLFWNKLNGASYPDLAGYNVYHKKAAGGAYSRINSHIITGKWFNDRFLLNDTTYDLTVTSIDTFGNESGFSQPVSVTPRDTFPPAKVADFHANLLPGGRVKLSWIKSSSYDCVKYNIYSDNAGGVIDYVNPMFSVPGFDTLWVSGVLAADTTITFALRAEDLFGHEEKNTSVVVKVRTIADTLGLVKARIMTPYAGKKISGDRVTVVAKLMFGGISKVKMVLFQYKSVDSTYWKAIATTGMHHSNPDSIPPYFVHWNISGLPLGNYCLRAVAVDTFNTADLNPPVVMVTIDNKRPDEEEHTFIAKIVEHIKQETVERMRNNMVLMGNESENNLTRIFMPENSLEENTTLTCIIRDAVNSPDPLPYLSTGAFRQIWLENGQTVMMGGLTSGIEISYVDSALGFAENDIWLARWTGSNWEPVTFDMDTVNNVVYGETDKVGTFFALLGPTIGAEENAAFNGKAINIKAYPNPSARMINISYQVPAKSEVSLKLYDLTGRQIRTLVNGIQQSGSYNVTWDGKTDNNKDAANGIYFYKLSVGKSKEIKKMVIMR